MVTSEWPAVTLAKSLLNPATIVFTLVICTLTYEGSFNSDYLVLAILVFFISAHIFDDVDVLRSWREIFPTTVGRRILLDWMNPWRVWDIRWRRCARCDLSERLRPCESDLRRHF